MKLPRNVFGRDLAQHLCRRWQYRIDHQTGSHIILDTDLPHPQRIAIPDHKPIRVGTLGGILQSVAAHKQVERDELLLDL